GFQAIVTAANAIQLGDADAALAGGAESMSRALYAMPAARWGARMNDARLLVMMVGALTDPFDGVHMGVTAENVAGRHGITRAAQDAFAVESHRRAAAAIDEGRFKSQILPIEIATRKATVVFDTDEHVRRDATLEGMAKLKAVFRKDGTVTAGNASGINDAAAALVLMDAASAERLDLKPLARLVSYGYAGVEPAYMGEGPIPAVRNALDRAGLAVDDIDVIESNEAFAAQALAVSNNLGFDPLRVNPNGGAVALGHPLGATGVLLSVKAIYELLRTGKRYALVTMCIGGGQGIAGIFERL
ncbi:MAG: acetyl-CoA C-acyltransferase, partial [Rhodocyclales bacterium CG17_big_fil_post_rev_8_21_14_2_50_68_7]